MHSSIWLRGRLQIQSKISGLETAMVVDGILQLTRPHADFLFRCPCTRLVEELLHVLVQAVQQFASRCVPIALRDAQIIMGVIGANVDRTNEVMVVSIHREPIPTKNMIATAPNSKTIR